MLSERLRPTRIASMIGNEQQRLELAKWLKYWKIGSKPVLLTGPPGIGKSTSVHAIANEMGYTVIELNASDARTKERLRESIGPTLENKTIFGDERLLIFLDEADGLSGRSDYAGMDYVLEFIENASLPVALAANVEDTQKLRKIEQKSLVLRFKQVDPKLVFAYLKSVNSRENLNVSEDTLSRIAQNCRGDVRQALNSLQALAGRDSIGSQTDHQFMNDANALDALLNAPTYEETILLLRQYDVSPYEKLRAIFDAVVSARTLSLEAKAEALEFICAADILVRRISAEQSWRLLRYLDRYLALAILGKKLHRVDSSLPWNLKLSIWNDSKVIKGMGIQLSEKYSVGLSTFASFYLPYLAFLFKSRPKVLEMFLKQNGFEDSERRVLIKLTTKK